ncbi:uncharacterized protein IWZ02DRAFT_221838 [Phyllosticta citriasiana]|uniref:uncharacterized protein n=1 Tax=Phyllosticta citriasiana TaxID=595635 RepID=UPI0030FD6B09
MSDKLMDTAPGGQSTQYESIKQFTNPPDKDVGQLGSTSTHFPSPSPSRQNFVAVSQLIRNACTHVDPGAATKSASSAHDDKAAHKTKEQLGEAGGLGGAGAGADDEADAEQRARREQGYGGARDMRRDVGA